MKEIVVSNWGVTPTTYSDRLCTDVVQFCARGKTLTAFAAFVGVTLKTVGVWQNKYPAFKEAVDAAKEAQMVYWEELSLAQTTGEVKGSAAALIFTMKNRFKEHYKDKHEIDHGGELNFTFDTGIKRDIPEELPAIEVESKVVPDSDLL